MRDTTRYPITKQEIINCLLDIKIETMKEEGCGDMRPILLETTINFIEAYMSDDLKAS